MSNAAHTLVEPASTAHEYVADGQQWRWCEASQTAPAVRHLGRRASAALFSHTMVPHLERRGAAGLVYPATGLGGDSREARWVVWRAPGNRHAMWGLYVCTSLLRDDVTQPENDAWVLLAWGEGPVLAWIDESPDARAIFRSAMQDPPAWFSNGMRSGDPTFAARLDRAEGHSIQRRALPPCAAVVPPSVLPGPLAGTREVVVVLARAWRVAMMGTVADA